MGKLSQIGITLERRCGLYYGLLVVFEGGLEVERRFATGNFFKDYALAMDWAEDIADSVVVDPTLDEYYRSMKGVPV
jgi:hypothetical protein